MIYFTRQEQRILIFLGVIVILGLGVLLMKRFQPGYAMRVSSGRPDFDVSQKSPPQENIMSAPKDKNQKTIQPPRIVSPIEQSIQSSGPDKNQKQDILSQDRKININTASLKELESLPRIGKVLAQRILDYRQKQGNFKSVDELKNVSGIGEATLKKIESLITVEDSGSE